MSVERWMTNQYLSRWSSLTWSRCRWYRMAGNSLLPEFEGSYKIDMEGRGRIKSQDDGAVISLSKLCPNLLKLNKQCQTHVLPKGENRCENTRINKWRIKTTRSWDETENGQNTICEPRCGNRHNQQLNTRPERPMETSCSADVQYAISLHQLFCHLAAMHQVHVLFNHAHSQWKHWAERDTRV